MSGHCAVHSLFAAYARWKHRLELSIDWESQQRRALSKCLKLAGHSRFQQDHQLGLNLDPKTYQTLVPVRTYPELVHDYGGGEYPDYQGILTEQEIRFLLVSSGTTGGHGKYFPLTSAGLRGYKLTALSQVMSCIAAMGHAKPFLHPFLAIGDAAPLVEVRKGLPLGAITRVLADTAPWMARRQSLQLEESNDPSVTRLERLTRAALQTDLGCLSGMTHWLLEFARLALEFSGKSTIRDIWPNLQVIGHGGVPAAVYQEPLRDVFSPNLERPFVAAEAYAASEGYLALGDPMLDGQLRLSSQNGIFYEFIPVESFGQENPSRVGVHEVEAGRGYVMVVTTPSGLWSHVVGDIVEFLDADRKTLKVLGRLSGTIQIWNEHFSESDADIVFSRLRQGSVSQPSFYHIGPQRYADGTQRGRYVCLVEEAGIEREQEENYVLKLDAEIQSVNKIYRGLREPGGLLDEPLVYHVPTGFFQTWLEDGARGAFQRKVPRVDASGTLTSELVRRLENRDA